MDTKELTKEQMIALMIKWAEAHPEPSQMHVTSMNERLADLCESALYASGRDDWGGCVLCRS